MTENKKQESAQPQPKKEEQKEQQPKRESLWQKFKKNLFLDTFE